MKRHWRALLILVAVVSLAVAASYPIRYWMEERSTDAGMERLQAMRQEGIARQGPAEEGRESERSEEAPEARGDAEESEPSGEETGGAEDAASSSVHEREPEESESQESETGAEAPVSGGGVAPGESIAAGESAAPAGNVETSGAQGATPSPAPAPTPTPALTADRFERDGPIPYDQKQKRTLDVDAILPEFREMYEENPDLVGWIAIPGTVIDYPVVQSQDSEFYLKHDFFGKKNANGQIILDAKCDPYTPSYNLVISGHSMKSGKMFGRLVNYMYESYWKNHKLVYFDTLMERKTYVVFAAFFSADYDVDEEGFRYNADVEYGLDARQWLREIRENELYDTGIEAEFGDEFLTLTTCNKAHHRDGRFVVVCRRLREGEEIE